MVLAHDRRGLFLVIFILLQSLASPFAAPHQREQRVLRVLTRAPTDPQILPKDSQIQRDIQFSAGQ